MNIRFLRSLALLVLATCLSGAGGAAILRVASQHDPGTLDPHALSSLYSNRVLSQVYETLVDRDENFRIGPKLALSWTALEGGKGFRFKLRPNVKFHDGTPFTADDVVFTVKRGLDPLSQYRTALPNVTGATKVDTLTVDILTSQPTPILPPSLINLRLVSKAWCEKHRVERPQDFKAKEETFAARNTNGTGPYRLERWDADVRTVFKANPDYWGKRGNITEAHYLVVSSAATRVAGLISGEIDVVVDPAVQDVVRLNGQAGITVGQATGLGSQYLGFNYDRKDLGNASTAGRNPFKDVRVRQAIRMAIDVPALQVKVMRNTASFGRALYTSAAEGFDPRLKSMPTYDVGRAKALLKEAGYPDGFSVDLDCSAQQPTDSICQAVSGMLSRIGIRVTYRPLPFNTLIPKLLAGDTNMYVIGWTAATGDPESALVPLARSKNRPGLGEYNFGRYSNPKVDALIDEGSLEFNPARRAFLFTQASEALDSDAAFVPLIYRNVTWAMRKGVKALIRPNDILDLRFVNIE
jgi:peptide/nickel transport system substrate-binding protein